MRLDWLTASPWPLLALVLVGVVLLAAVAWQMERGAQRAYERLVESGVPAEATVLRARDSGWRTNGRVHIVYELEVWRPGGRPYKATARLQIHRPWSPIPYPPGSVVAVRVDPYRPERVAIAGGTPVLGGALAPDMPPGGGYATGDGADPAWRLRMLKAMCDEGLITPEEFEAKKAQILERL
jgi:hypothetical protein